MAKLPKPVKTFTYEALVLDDVITRAFIPYLIGKTITYTVMYYKDSEVCCIVLYEDFGNVGSEENTFSVPVQTLDKCFFNLTTEASKILYKNK